MKLKKFIRKYSMDRDSFYKIYLDPTRITAIGLKENMKILTDCYPYNDIPLTLKEINALNNDIYIKLGDTWYWQGCIKRAKRFFGRRVLFYYSEKLNPLICTTEKSEYIFAVAPRFSNNIWDDNLEVQWEFDKKEVFEKYTGCKCPKILKKKK